MKKFIIPLASVAVAAVAATVGLIAINSNKAVADEPKVPLELKDGSYYVDGDPANNDFYIVVEGETIRFQSDTGDLRDAFKAIELSDCRVEEENLEQQVDLDMEYWGKDYCNYELDRFNIPDPNASDVLFVGWDPEFFNRNDNIFFVHWKGTGTMFYSVEKKMIRGGFFGNFVLYEDEAGISDKTPSDAGDGDDLSTVSDNDANF